MNESLAADRKWLALQAKTCSLQASMPHQIPPLIGPLLVLLALYEVAQLLDTVTGVFVQGHDPVPGARNMHGAESNGGMRHLELWRGAQRDLHWRKPA